MKYLALGFELSPEYPSTIIIELNEIPTEKDAQKIANQFEKCDLEPDYIWILKNGVERPEYVAEFRLYRHYRFEAKNE